MTLNERVLASLSIAIFLYSYHIVFIWMDEGMDCNNMYISLRVLYL